MTRACGCATSRPRWASPSAAPTASSATLPRPATPAGRKTADHVHAWEKEDPDFEAAPRLGMFGLAPEAIAVQTATSYCDWHLIPDTNQMEAGRHAVLAPLAITGGRCPPRRSRGQLPAAPGPNASASPAHPLQHRRRADAGRCRAPGRGAHP